ncbi:MAG: dUTP diphosphatase [Lachnospiraceae bacterium]|nr:dUTP diphosphatase [Lachnospiraceae bacterium]
MKVNIKKLNENAIIPSRGSEQAAGMDLYACTSTPVVIAPHETVMVGTGLAIETPVGYASLIFARSGLASKQGLAPANKIGLVDSDYRGEVKVALHNHSNEPQIINPMERIAQLVVMPYLQVEFNEVDELSETERGERGFGSTGK